MLPTSPRICNRPTYAFLEEVGCFVSKEKFRALQTMLSSSSTMYSSEVSLSTDRSPSPPAASPAPPPNGPHADEEKETSKNGKKLTHVTKDRPRRKVRPPSRELWRKNLVKLHPPARPPLPKVTMMVESNGSVMPVLPPPPIESAPPLTSAALLNSGEFSPLPF